MADSKEAWLCLEDGTVIKGSGFGAEAKASGEVVFTTAMNGYPESFTDPSYKGQILVMTHPLIGNYGVPEKISSKGILENFESEDIKPEGIIISELTRPTKWNSTMDLDQWLKNDKIPGMQGVDTRMLTKKVREHGVMLGTICNSGEQPKMDRSYDYEKINFVERVSPKEPITHELGRENIVVVDCGIKHGLLYDLSAFGYNLVRVPYNYSADKIMSYNPVGIFYSNGPGNPNLLSDVVKNFSDLLEYKVPTLGVCLGHQIATLALGGKVSKMKFGHRAINKAVVDVKSKMAYITTHNHGYALYSKDMPEGVETWFMSPDDDVVEGIIRDNLITAQFHPEARPGTNDGKFILGLFSKMIKHETG